MVLEQPRPRVVIALPVLDLERAKRFYSENLGLRCTDVEGASQQAAVVQCSRGAQIVLYAHELSRAVCPEWHVENLDEAIAYLRGRGVVFEQYHLPGLRTDERGIAEGAGGRTAWFTDTEGNLLRISEVRR